MALRSHVHLECGLEIPDAYIRVRKVRISKSGMVVVADVFVDAVAAKASAPPVATRVFRRPYSEDAGTFMSGYRHLKTLPEFHGAEDC